MKKEMAAPGATDILGGVELGRWLLQVRQHRGLSRGELGEKVGLSVSGIQKIEMGGNPTVLVLGRMLEGLGVKGRLKVTEI